MLHKTSLRCNLALNEKLCDELSACNFVANNAERQKNAYLIIILFFRYLLIRSILFFDESRMCIDHTYKGEKNTEIHMNIDEDITML